MTEVQGANQVDLMVTNHEEYASFFEAFPMFDDGQHHDGEPNDGVYGAMIPYSTLDTKVKYYVRAQSDNAMSLDPPRAEYEYFKYKIRPDFTTSATSGEYVLPSKYSVYPNPCTSSFNVGGDLATIRKFELFDASGATIKTVNHPGDKTILTNDLSSGMYTLSIYTDQGKVVKKVSVVK